MFFSPRSRFSRFAAIPALLLLTSFSAGAQIEAIAPAQVAPPVPQPIFGNMADYLPRLVYDAAESGPLIVVGLDANYKLERPLPEKNKPAPALATLGSAFGRRIVNIGRLTVLAPREMTNINTNPGKASVLEGLQGGELFQWLIASFTSEQWAKACSDGISLTDMNAEQRPFFDHILPKKIRVQKSVVDKTDVAPNSFGFSGHNEGDPVDIDRNRLRMRFSRNTTVMFRSGDKTNSYYSGGGGNYENYKVGDFYWRRVRDGSEYQQQERDKAYGVPILIKSVNRLKPGDLDYKAAALNRPVALSNDIKTLSALVKLVSAALNLEILADRRAAELPVFVRVAPNQTVRAGDVLEGLAWSVTGAFRQIGERTFLLTHDIEGLGTQWARVTQWGEQASQEKQRLLEKAMEQAAKRLPASRLNYAPGDARALPPDVVGKIEEKWRTGDSWMGYEVETAKLPADFRTWIEGSAKVWEQSSEPVKVQTDKVHVNMQMRGQWVTSDGLVISDLGYGAQMDSYSLSRFLTDGFRPKPTAPKPDEKKLPRSFDAKVTRRILIIAPKTAKEAEETLVEAKKRGFTELWVRKTLDKLDADALKPLNAAIAAGKKAGVPIVALAPVMRENGAGEEDLNLLGQTGSQYVESQIAKQERDRAALSITPDSWEWLLWSRMYLEQERGWVAPTPAAVEQIARRAAQLAETPGLAGMAVYQSTPSGYFRPASDQFGIPNVAAGGFGYVLPLRLAFLRAENIDPVDIPPQYLNLNVEQSLPFFSQENFQQRYKQIGDRFETDKSYVPPPAAWTEFRDKTVLDTLRRVYTEIRRAKPKLPLYQDDRIAGQGGAANFFGSFDAADKTPRHPMYVGGSEIAAAARAASETIFLRQMVNTRAQPGIPPDKRAVQFAEMIGLQTKDVMQNWDGIAVDFTFVSPEDTLLLLRAIEPAK